MKRFSIQAAAIACAAVLVSVMSPTRANAQFEAPADMLGTRIGTAVGVFAPLDAAIVSGDGRHTRLGAGNAFSLDVQQGVAEFAALYVGGIAGFSTLARGTEINPAATGSDHVLVATATGGVVLGYAGLHPTIVPTLRLGGGVKAYSFDLAGAESHTRLTGDIGLGLRGVLSAVDVGAEIRYLPSTFDQARLPTRGIAPQEQRQTDLVMGLSVGLRL